MGASWWHMVYPFFLPPFCHSQWVLCVYNDAKNDRSDRNHKMDEFNNRDAPASAIYFAVVSIQSRVLLVSFVLSCLVGAGVRFAVRDDGLIGFMFCLLWLLISFVAFLLIGVIMAGKLIAMGDDNRKGRHDNGRYRADAFYAQKMMRYVEDATEHRARGGKLMGYMVGDRYMSVEEIAKALRDTGGVGGNAK